MSRKFLLSVSMLVLAAGALTAPVAAQTFVGTPTPPQFARQGQPSTLNGEWPTNGADVKFTRYSPLDQINASNFNKLEVAWRFKTDAFGPYPEYKLEGTPIMVKGVLYTTAGTRRAVVALDAATGEELWVHSENEGPRGRNAPRQLSGRGLSYWTDGNEERVFYVTPGYRLVALSAKTGARIATFGKDGMVDLKEDDDQIIDPVTGEVGLHSAPVVANDTIIVGAAHRSGGVPRGKTNVKGYVRAFDVRTGKRLWIFHTIPKPGEFGYNTWEKDSADYTGNTGVWGQISVDEQLGMAYLPVELPTGDYYGGHRPGNGLFGESIVAVDLKTGVRKWHYQLVHHGVWDMDIPCAPMLVDLTVNGRPVKALAQPTKQAFLYMFDRVTGQPIFPREERPVEQSTVPDEKTSATQPFPTKPPAYDRQGFSMDDLIDFTPELNAQAKEIVSHFKIGPIFTPPVLSQRPGPLGTLAFATAGGGTNWSGGSLDPETGIAYLPSQKSLSNLGLVPSDPKTNDFRFVQGNAIAGARTTAGAGADGGAEPAGGEGGGAPAVRLTVQELPLFKPPYGQISAIDMNKGEILWQVARGETPDLVRNHPALKGVTIPRTGRGGIAGLIVTKTLVIGGEPGTITMPDGKKGAYLRAYDKKTGGDAGAVPMPAGQTGSPMTYMLNGKQYIVVAVGAAGFPAEYIAYRLPN
jgi:quinoprotein glucose dehydrogenase